MGIICCNSCKKTRQTFCLFIIDFLATITICTNSNICPRDHSNYNNLCQTPPPKKTEHEVASQGMDVWHCNYYQRALLIIICCFSFGNHLVSRKVVPICHNRIIDVSCSLTISKWLNFHLLIVSNFILRDLFLLITVTVSV